MNTIRNATRVGAATALALLLSLTLLAGCGGGSSGSGSGSGGVASLDTSKSSKDSGDSSASSSKDSEKELLAYTKCLRKQGLDIDDPTVDANGNVQLNPGGGAGGAGPGADRPNIDRKAMEKAQKACGDLPDSVTQQFNNVDQTKAQDTLLKYAKCMRKNGVDMADPDFSSIPSGGPGQGGGQDGGQGGQGGGPFGDVDRNDPDYKKASEACQSLLAGIGPGQSTTTEAN